MSDISTLESLAEFWERVDYVGLILVFVGVIGESVLEFTRLVKSDFWTPKLGKASALVLCVGLALELMAFSKLSAINWQVVGILHVQAADAQTVASAALQKTADAESRLEDANEQAAKAQERAAHAVNATAEERAARVTSEARVTSKLELLQAQVLDTVSFARPVHFVTPDVTETVASPGTYYVLSAGQHRLKLVGLKGEPTLVVDALGTTHTEDIGTPIALNVQDEAHAPRVALLLPGGAGLEAFGSYDMTRERGLRTLTPAQLHQALTRKLASGSPAAVMILNPA